jgi:hypothetical protein
MDDDEFSYADGGNLASVVPSLEPPPAPGTNAEAASVDVWALSDDAAPTRDVRPLHSSAGGSLEPNSPVVRHWTPAEDDGGVESIEEIEVDDVSADDVPVESLPSEPVPSAPAYQADSAWNQSQGEAWSEDKPELESLASAAAAQSQHSHWANAQPAELAEPDDEDEDWLDDRGATAPTPARVDGRAARTESEVQRTNIAEMVVQTAEFVADVAHEEVPQLPKEQLLQVAREVIERIAWEVVPELAETIIQAELQRLLAEQR